MKWVAVWLVLVNVASYFWLQRYDTTQINADVNHFEGINLKQMSLKVDRLASIESAEVEEQTITRIDLTDKAPDAKPTELVKIDSEGVQSQSDVVLEPKREALPVVGVVDEIESVKVSASVSGSAAITKEGEVAELASVMASIDPQMDKGIFDAPAPVEEPAARLCYRVGPYTAQGALDNAVSVISEQNIEFAVTEVSSEKQIKAARVYIGPFSSDDAMQSMRAQLKEKRVDHYVINLKGKNLLQLGYFSGLSRGQNYQKRLVKEGFEAKLDKIYKDKLSDAWINFEVQSEGQLLGLEQLKFYRVASIEKRTCS